MCLDARDAVQPPKDDWEDGSLDLPNFCQERQNPVSKQLILYGQVARIGLDLATFRGARTEISDEIGERLFQRADKLDQDGTLSVQFRTLAF